MHEPQRGRVFQEALGPRETYFQAHWILLRSCLGDTQNQTHWEITQTPRASLDFQLNSTIFTMFKGDVGKWFRHLLQVNKPPTESNHCWRDVDGRHCCNGHASSLELYIGIPIMLIIELGDPEDEGNQWTFPKHLRPLSNDAETNDGLVYDVVGRVLYKHSSSHYIARFSPNGKLVYDYDSMKHGGSAVCNSDARVITHIAGSSNTNPPGCRTWALVYHLRGGVNAQARYTQDQIAQTARIHPIIHFTSSSDGSLPTVGVTREDIVRVPDEDRFWRSNPHNTKSAEYEIKRHPEPKSSAKSSRKRQLSPSVNDSSPLKKPSKRPRWNIVESSDIDAGDDTASSENIDVKNLDKTFDSHPNSSQASEFPFTCRCGAIGDGHLLSDMEEAIQCKQCETWSHVACQRGARASNLRSNQNFSCDTCNPPKLVANLPKTSKR